MMTSSSWAPLLISSLPFCLVSSSFKNCFVLVGGVENEMVTTRIAWVDFFFKKKNNKETYFSVGNRIEFEKETHTHTHTKNRVWVCVDFGDDSFDVGHTHRRVNSFCPACKSTDSFFFFFSFVLSTRKKNVVAPPTFPWWWCATHPNGVKWWL